MNRNLAKLQPFSLSRVFVAAILCAAVESRAAPADKHRRTTGNRLTNTIGMDFVPVPAGTFWMGSPATEPGRDDDEPRRRVRLSRDFYMGVYEVTQRQFVKVMGENPSRFRPGGAFADRIGSAARAKDHPVDSVSWGQAREFCRRLSSDPVEKAAGRRYRLPTEAEWERAARCGKKSIWPFGDRLADLADHAHYRRRRSALATRPVGSLKPNAWGLYDMYGNVWEWCADWYDEQPAARPVMVDPRGPMQGTRRVIRGGSWYSPAASCRTASRAADAPSVTDPDTGFRVVLVIDDAAASD